MNSLDKIRMKEETIRSYHTPGNNTTRPKNAIFISDANSPLHEISKCVAAILLRKTGDVKFTNAMISQIRTLSVTLEWEMKGFNESHDFITEAVPSLEPNRRVDLVDLDTNTRYEFEVNPKIKKENAVTIYL